MKYNSSSEILRKKGRNGDTILAHINPMEAKLLELVGGSGTINPKTGLPEYFFSGVRRFFKNPVKVIGSALKNPRNMLGEIAAIGGALMGGPIGGAAGGAAKALIRNRKDESVLGGALKGAAWGAAAGPTANLLGQGLSKIGANAIGQGLQDYGTKAGASYLGHLGKVGGGVNSWFSSAPGVAGAAKGASYTDRAFQALPLLSGGISAGGEQQMSPQDNYYTLKQKLEEEKRAENNQPFFTKLGRKSGEFLSNPINLMSLGSVAANIAGREKPISAAQQGRNAKEMMFAQYLNPQEMERKRAYEFNLSENDKKNEVDGRLTSDQIEGKRQYEANLEKARIQNEKQSVFERQESPEEIEQNRERYLLKQQAKNKNAKYNQFDVMDTYEEIEKKRINQANIEQAQRKNEKLDKRNQRLTDDELEEKRIYKLLKTKGKRKNAREQFLPEERIDIKPIYYKTNTPEEYARTNKWRQEYEDPEFTRKSNQFN